MNTQLTFIYLLTLYEVIYSIKVRRSIVRYEKSNFNHFLVVRSISERELRKNEGEINKSTIPIQI